MAVDTDFTSLFNKLKVEDPWLPPRPWESIPTESGRSIASTSLSSSSVSRRLYGASTVSEASLVRLALNGLQGLESSLTSIDRLCTIFRCNPTDRTFHRIPSLWKQSVSTLALEKILRSLGCMGCEVLFLRKFVNHFTNLNWDATKAERSHYPPYSLVNQAFAVAIGDVLEGYVAALDTLSSSVGLRRVGQSQVTLLEVFLHTKELTSQIEAVGSICSVHNVALSFSFSPLEDLHTRTNFTDFPRGGNLLTYLYNELKVADPVHCSLLKTLFVRSCEPYFGFIRSWIFKAKIIDPFNEFIVSEADSLESYSLSNTGVVVDFPSASIRGPEDGVSAPYFLREFLIPLFRAGQQLQVLIKLLEFSDGVGSWNRTYEEFLPYWSKTSTSHASHTPFTKQGIEMMVLARRDYYKLMMDKLNNRLPNLDFRYHQVIAQSTVVSNGRASLVVASGSVSPPAKNMNKNLPVDSDPEVEEDPWDSSEDTVEVFHDSEDVEKKYLSALEFKSDTPKKTSSSSRVGNLSPINNGIGNIEEAAANNHHALWEGTSKLRERCPKVKLPCFDFKSIRDPFSVCVDRLSASVSGATMRNYGDKIKDHGDDQEEALLLPGGGCCQVVVDDKNDIQQHNTSSIMAAAVIEMPLDFVLEKGLLEEIQLQYIYVSKLTIKLLEEGFCLQQHLLALRRYHMMESADWADLFIMSLWHHKWYADKRISEIQGLLELSFQRSSCETDPYKDRVFVYMKQQASTSLPGIQSLNVLGLGYTVDWPVSIVLTPAALNIYAQIFTFLIQIKLALSSLTQVWCSFKEFISFSKKDRHFNVMVKLRHQIFHFVSTLQQYVQSQLSHVSWCRFLQSLKHKVKDLTDLELVHMDYLKDSQCICFLSNDMKEIGEIIESILQCALDFRSVSSAGVDVNVAQVVRIKEAFEEKMRQLYVLYLKSPKNVEFSLPRFWEYLNYNNHFSDVINKQMGHAAAILSL